MSSQVKRGFDLALTVPMLIFFAPIMLLIALLIRLRIGAPVMFRQVRAGYKGRPFLLLKFRTMTDGRDRHNLLLPDSERITGLGRFLRATSLDELPQLWNVLFGQMSLVGPRPLLMEYNSRYTPKQARRLTILPGVTGWAQVNGRNAITWEKKFELDLWYVDRASIGLDLRILINTLRRVLLREGISHTGHATMTEFLGTEHCTD